MKLKNHPLRPLYQRQAIACAVHPLRHCAVRWVPTGHSSSQPLQQKCLNAAGEGSQSQQQRPQAVRVSLSGACAAHYSPRTQNGQQQWQYAPEQHCGQQRPLGVREQRILYQQQQTQQQTQSAPQVGERSMSSLPSRLIDRWGLRCSAPTDHHRQQQRYQYC